MRGSRTLVTLLFGCLVASACQSDNESSANLNVDILIRDGLVFAGEIDQGLQPNDIGIRGDKIAFVGDADASRVSGNKELSAAGMIVTAGFIDPHTHSLDELLSTDRNGNENYLFQGVTTVFNGNDGGGQVDVANLAATLEANGIGTNTALYIGHGEVRRQVMGGANRAPTDGELTDMSELVRAGMRAGALGLSSGLFYAPGSFSDTAEVAQLAAAAAEFGGVYDTHIRDESSYSIGLLEAIDEALEVGRIANIPVHIAHIKALGVDVWAQSAAVIALIEAAQASGQTVTADQYPWRASGTHLRNALLPRSLLEGEKADYLERLRDPLVISDVRKAVLENLRRRGGPESLLIVSANDPGIDGKTLAEIAIARETSAFDAAINIMLAGSTRIASFNMNQNDITAFMTRNWVMTSSDGTNGHPRKYASFPQKYQAYVVRDPILSVEEFLYRSSALTAETFGLSDRGRIREGLAADVIVLDPEEFAPLADFDQWNVLSTGISHSIVNGQHVIQDGRYTGGLAGRVLLKTANR